jgi:hypothetical protein
VCVCVCVCVCVSECGWWVEVGMGVWLTGPSNADIVAVVKLLWI